MELDEDFFNHEWVLVLNKKGVLKRLKCPFKALLIVEAEFLSLNEIYNITAVITNYRNVMMYAVKGHAYYYYCFIILD